MDAATLLQEFENLAERLSVQIRYGKLDREGGLCRYRDAYHIIVNKRLDAIGRITVLARAFAQLPLDDVFLIPAIREAIDTHQDEEPSTLPGEEFDPEDTESVV